MGEPDPQEWIEWSKIKRGYLVKHEARRRWAQVLSDTRKSQFETGQPGQLLVCFIDTLGVDSWTVGEVSMVVALGKVIAKNDALIERLKREEDEFYARLRRGRVHGGGGGGDPGEVQQVPPGVPGA